MARDAKRERLQTRKREQAVYFEWSHGWLSDGYELAGGAMAAAEPAPDAAAADRARGEARRRGGAEARRCTRHRTDVGLVDGYSDQPLHDRWRAGEGHRGVRAARDRGPRAPKRCARGAD